MKYNKPHFYFLITAIIILLLGIFNNQFKKNEDSVFDLNIHDTYYIVDHFVITEFLTILFLILGFGYWILEKLNRKLNSKLTKFHCISTIGLLFLYWLFIKISNFIEITDNGISNIFLLIIFFIIAIAQIIYIINIGIGIVNRKK